MVRQEEGKRVKVWRFTCKVCGGQWERAFYSRGEALEYLRMRDVCWAGKHVVEGSLKGRVRVEKREG